MVASRTQETILEEMGVEPSPSPGGRLRRRVRDHPTLFPDGA